MKIISISDTHCRLRQVTVPDGDLLIHSGDLTFQGNVQEISQELRELGRIAKKFKHGCVLIAGNHDRLSERNPSLMEQMCKDEGLTYLCNSGVEINGLKLWGSPIQPSFCNWAWNRERGDEIKKYWDLIPDDINVLITHGPPMNILDGVEHFNGKTCKFELEHVGCWDLYNRVMQLKYLKLHVFGHIHCGAGSIKIGETTFINASICTEKYKPTNPPFIISIEGPGPLGPA